MRKILFRGKRLKNRGWQWGCLLVYGNRCFIIPSEELIESEVESRFYWHLLEKGYEVDPETVGQFTGLTDKNGKKIFEGDILTIAQRMDGMGEYYFPPIAYPGNVVVKWDMCAWMWETLGEHRLFISFPDAWCHFECEVIGNIHDNPELLEVSDGKEPCFDGA